MLQTRMNWQMNSFNYGLNMYIVLPGLHIRCNPETKRGMLGLGPWTQFPRVLRFSHLHWSSAPGSSFSAIIGQCDLWPSVMSQVNKTRTPPLFTLSSPVSLLLTAAKRQQGLFSRSPGISAGHAAESSWKLSALSVACSRQTHRTLLTAEDASACLRWTKIKIQ